VVIEKVSVLFSRYFRSEGVLEKLRRLGSLMYTEYRVVGSLKSLKYILTLAASGGDGIPPKILSREDDVVDEETGLHREKQIRNWRAIVNLGTRTLPFKLKDNYNAESAWY
jgi:hypothetical protein